MKINILPCSNGLGHTDRCFKIAKFLCSKENKIKFFCEKDTFTKFQDLYKIEKNIENFNIKKKFLKPIISKNDLLDFKNYDFKFEEKDIVISDSIIELLSITKNTILLSNFFWHKIKHVDKIVNVNANEIIKNYNGPILGSSIFAQDHVKSLKTFKSYSLLQKKISKKNSSSSILLSSGGTDAGIQPILSKKKYILKIFEKFQSVFIEPSLFKYFDKGKNIFRADYSENMYLNLSFAIIRPGIGTTSELISRNIPFYLIHEDNNQEMIFNSNKMIDLGYANYLKENDNIEILINQKKQKLDFNGLEEIYKVLKVTNINDSDIY